MFDMCCKFRKKLGCDNILVESIGQLLLAVPSSYVRIPNIPPNGIDSLNVQQERYSA